MTTSRASDPDRYPLLGAGDPPPVDVIEIDKPSPVLLLCDHAGNHIPQAMEQLGLPATLLNENHVAWDIGAATVTRLLSKRLHAPAVFGCYSRLLIDCNRQPGDPTSILPVSDGISVPGNQSLSDDEMEQRVESFFTPYHHAITQQLAYLLRHGTPPAVIAVHSFTPLFQGLQRPWELGLLWNHDPRLVEPLKRWFAEHDSICVGDNEPYSGRELGYTLDHHAAAAGLPHICLEIRQDLINDEAGCRRWAELIGVALEAVLSNESLHKVEHY